jgi:hypothetical protein
MMNFLKRFTSDSDSFRMKKFLFNWLVTGAVLAGMAGCAQIKKPAPRPGVMPTGVRFDQVGRVIMYVGEPCTPQIMFDFHGARSTVSLAAPMWETKILTDAANRNQRVHISGKWRRGAQRDCNYVQVTSAELTR